MLARRFLGVVVLVSMAGCRGDEPDAVVPVASHGTTSPRTTLPEDSGSSGESGDDAETTEEAVSPPIVRTQTVATGVVPFADSVEFLFTGDDAVQQDVAEGAIRSERVAVLRGRVLTRDGAGVGDVKVCVLHHPEYGHALTKDDGQFDMAVNGGGQLAVCYQLDGFLPIQRTVQVPWKEFVWLPDVTLVPEDSQVSAVDLTADVIQVARGSQIEDADGQRQGTLVLPADTTAEMVLPDGTTQPLEQLSLRITEYTVGDEGPAAMPATLPPTSGYTYCFELSVDEAAAAGSDHVVFNKPVFHYVENFLDFPVGSPVPVGYYDRNQGVWEPSDNGIIVQVLAVNDGLAELDVDGAGAAATVERMQELNITDDERGQLAALYQPGQSLWRVPIPHCTDPIDLNWPFGLPGDAEPPEPTPPQDPDWDPCWELFFSRIDIQNQSLLETIDLAGTRTQLSYHSARVRGRKAAYTLDIPLTGESMPESLQRIDLEVSIAGQQFRESFPAEPNLMHSITWDGRDAYGRLLQGSRMAHIRIGYAYTAVYMQPAEFSQSFARFSDTPLESSRARQEYVLWHDHTQPVGTWDALGQQLGGWTLSDHHAYDPIARTLYLGAGETHHTNSIDRVIDTIAGSGAGGLEDYGGFDGDGGLAIDARLNDPSGFAIAPDGTLYIADTDNHRVRRVIPDGVITTVAGSGGIESDGGGFAGDGGPAVEALLKYPMGVAVGPDGSLYIADVGNLRIRRVAPDGTINTIAGGGDAIPGDDGPATAARIWQSGSGSARDRYLSSTRSLVISSDGCLYFGDSFGSVRCVDPNGVITTLASGLDHPRGIAIHTDGSLYVTEWEGCRVQRIGPDGSVTLIAGTGEDAPSVEGLLATESPLGYPAGIAIDREGTVFISELHYLAAGNDDRYVHRLGADGTMLRYAGIGVSGFSGDGGPALQAQLLGVGDVKIGPDDNLYICDTGNHRVRRIGETLSGASVNEIAVPSRQGDEIYIFDPQGRHLRTLDALTGQSLREFGYDDQSLLISVTGAYGRTLQIERDGNGLPVAIVSHNGKRTELQTGTGGYLTGVSSPNGETTGLSYTAGEGLLTELTDSFGHLHHYRYDETGRLISDEDPAGGFVELARSATATSFEVKAGTALGSERTYRVEQTADGGQRKTNLDAGDVSITSERASDGSRTVTLHDGTEMSWMSAPDPRWGTQSANVSSWSMTTPGGRQLTVENQLEAELFNPGDPLSLSSLTATRTINGQVSTATLDLAEGTFAVTSPLGRTTTLHEDLYGRVHETWAEGMDPLISSFDEFDRIRKLQSGDLVIAFEYDDADRVTSVSNAAGETLQMVYDPRGRVVSMTTPGGATYGLSYDPAGDWTELKMPSGTAHRLTYTPIGQQSGYVLPDGSAYATAYDVDRRPTSVTLPGGRMIQNSYDSAGRWIGLNYPEASITASYPAAGAACCGAEPPANLVWTPVDGSAQEMLFERDGQLLLGVEFRGASEGRFRYRYDENFQVVGVTLDNEPELALTRDADGLVIGYGTFAAERDAATGLPRRISDGTADVFIEYDSLGRIATRGHSIGGVEVYRLALTYDNVGRIAERKETLSSVTRTDRFSYDLDGRLTQVARDGVVIESYAYDANGNRTTRLSGAVEQNATFDEQDRLVSLGEVSFEFDADGFLGSRGEDAFEYSARGELLAAQLADGTQVAYSYDPIGRRVARTDATGTLQFLYGDPGQPFQVTASRDAAGVLTSYHYETGGTLFALERGGERFYVASDQVGTPRLICDASGAVIRTIDYDAFGAVVSYSGEEFALPIGFAGGISDPATGLVRFGFRDYDPNAGSWTARDPLLFQSGQANLYAYVGNDPVNSVDPSGLFNWGFSDRGWGWGYGQNFWDFGMSPNVWECISNLAAGFGDGISWVFGLPFGGFNVSDWGRNLFGDDSGQVNRSSYSYNLPWGLGAAWGATTLAIGVVENAAAAMPRNVPYQSVRMPFGARGATNLRTGDIFVNNRLTGTEFTKTLTHEWGHRVLTPSSPAANWVRRTLFQNSNLYKFTEESLVHAISRGSVTTGIEYGASVTNPGIVIVEGVVYVVSAGTGVIIGYYYVDE